MQRKYILAGHCVFAGEHVALAVPSRLNDVTRKGSQTRVLDGCENDVANAVVSEVKPVQSAGDRRRISVEVARHVGAFVAAFKPLFVDRHLTSKLIDARAGIGQRDRKRCRPGIAVRVGNPICEGFDFRPIRGHIMSGGVLEVVTVNDDRAAEGARADDLDIRSARAVGAKHIAAQERAYAVDNDVVRDFIVDSRKAPLIVSNGRVIDHRHTDAARGQVPIVVRTHDRDAADRKAVDVDAVLVPEVVEQGRGYRHAAACADVDRARAAQL